MIIGATLIETRCRLGVCLFSIFLPLPLLFFSKHRALSAFLKLSVVLLFLIGLFDSNLLLRDSLLPKSQSRLSSSRLPIDLKVKRGLLTLLYRVELCSVIGVTFVRVSPDMKS